MTPPPLFEWSGKAEEFQEYLNQVYEIFLADFVRAKHRFLGKPVKARWAPAHDNKHYCFWHIISEEGKTPEEKDRLPDLARCSRISWIGYVLSNCNDKAIWCWRTERQTKRGRDKRYLLYLPAQRYIVVLSEAEEYFMLVTAYCVKFENVHKRLEKQYRENGDPRC